MLLAYEGIKQKERTNEHSSWCEPVWPSGKALSPFLTGRTFVRETSWEYSANLVGS